MADLTLSIPHKLEALFETVATGASGDLAISGDLEVDGTITADITSTTVTAGSFVATTPATIDTSALNGSANAAQIEAVVDALVIALDALGLVTEDDGA